MKQSINGHMQTAASTTGELIFVYNAESGLGNALLDVGRRIVQPKDYPCSLCMITYGPFGMKKDWNEFLRTLPYNVRFLHKDELSTEMPNTTFPLPGLILHSEKADKILLSANDFKDIRSLDELKEKVTSSLRSIR